MHVKSALGTIVLSLDMVPFVYILHSAFCYIYSHGTNTSIAFNSQWNLGKNMHMCPLDSTLSSTNVGFLKSSNLVLFIYLRLIPFVSTPPAGQLQESKCPTVSTQEMSSINSTICRKSIYRCQHPIYSCKGHVAPDSMHAVSHIH